MRILVVSATEAEVALVLSRLGRVSDPGDRIKTGKRGAHQVDVVVTGVGMVATAGWCSRALARTRYDLALNFGVCGTFDPALMPPVVVHIVSDRIADLGAEDDEQFLTAQELDLLGANEFPFRDSLLLNSNPPPNAALRDLPAVNGITVNTAHGSPRSIAAAVERFHPQVESMEGAAFMYACLIHKLPFAQVRAVSNIVEKRNRGAWKLAEAVHALGNTALRVLDQA